ncbi:hypothetical protein [Pectobacterium polaris]|uniref:hypothetical protein n=1 Tax=Pectobacterium polaris TaxID=2042057 RepID=UPI0032E4A98C
MSDSSNIGKDFGLVDKYDNSRFHGKHIDTLTVKVAPSGTLYTDANGSTKESMFGHIWVEFQNESIGWGLGETKSNGGAENLTFRDSIGYDPARTSSVIFPLYSQNVVENIVNYLSDLKNGNFNNFSPNYNLLTNNCIDFVNSILSMTHYDNDKHGLDHINEISERTPDKIVENLDKIVSDQESTETPLVIDLMGDGIMTLKEDGSITFDHNNDGIKESTGWISNKNAFLVWDKNSDAIINNGNELFGNNTELFYGSKASHGFAALAEHDSKQDGIINAEDNIWESLALWIDDNQNGITEAHELLSIRETEIASISLDYHKNGFVDDNENIHALTSQVTWNNGTTTDITDVIFTTGNYPPAELIGINTSANELSGGIYA